MTRQQKQANPRLLGGLTSRTFLARYWQKKPLLIRQAIPGFRGVLSREQLFALACDEDVESRLVERGADGWKVERGPFALRRLKRRRPWPWSVLVQGANLFLPDADRLLRHFDFIPYARLDDMMVSYANEGGGVGPHFDSYDVFLLQGIGRRRWRIGKQRNLALVEEAPLKILRDFRPSQELVLEGGDMLYLPPQYAHEGIAEGDCMTYSIGFRAPTAQELTVEFLAFLQERVQARERFRDPGLKPAVHPAAINKEMLEFVTKTIARLRWNRSAISEFLGCFLTEPKPHVYFSPPARPQSLAQFSRRCRHAGVRLNSRTQMLFHRSTFFINGEALCVPVACRAALRQLADDRRLDNLGGSSESVFEFLYRWYRCGYLEPEPRQ